MWSGSVCRDGGPTVPRGSSRSAGRGIFTFRGTHRNPSGSWAGAVVGRSAGPEGGGVVGRRSVSVAGPSIVQEGASCAPTGSWRSAERESSAGGGGRIFEFQRPGQGTDLGGCLGRTGTRGDSVVRGTIAASVSRHGPQARRPFRGTSPDRGARSAERVRWVGPSVPRAAAIQRGVGGGPIPRGGRRGGNQATPKR